MKLPKIFKPKKKQKKTIKKLLKENSHTISELKDAYHEFSKEQKTLTLAEKYKLGETIAGTINYTKIELENLLEAMMPVEKTGLGFYLSTLVNKIIKENDEITLNMKNQIITHLGSYLEKGTLIINGDAGSWTGYNMKGGTLIIKGHAKNFIGYYMKNGKMVVEKDLGYDTGCNMDGGEIHCDGNISEISPTCDGEIYKKGKKVWPKKKLLEWI